MARCARRKWPIFGRKRERLSLKNPGLEPILDSPPRGVFFPMEELPLECSSTSNLQTRIFVANKRRSPARPVAVRPDKT